MSSRSQHDLVQEVEEIRAKLMVNKNHVQSFSISPGTVRGFLIIWVIVILGFYVFIKGLTEPPIHFIVAFNIILAYYGIKPKDILPTPLQASIPTDYGTLKRYKPLDEFLDKTNNFLEDIKNQVIDIVGNLEAIGKSYEDKANKYLADIKEEIDQFTILVKKLSVKGKTVIEQIGLLILLVAIGIFSIWYIETYNEPLDAITISLAAFISAISIAFGTNLQDIMAKYVQPHIRNSKIIIEQSIFEVSQILTPVKDITGETISKIQKEINNVREANLMIYLPKDIIAAISILFMTFLGGLLLILPEVVLSEFFLLILEFIIGYYFITKK